MLRVAWRQCRPQWNARLAALATERPKAEKPNFLRLDRIPGPTTTTLGDKVDAWLHPIDRSSPTGLFGSDLKRAADFAGWARKARETADEALASVLQEVALRELDRISEAVCRVVDCAEVLRHTGTEAWRRAAGAAQADLQAYLHQLNSSPGLFRRLAELEGQTSGQARWFVADLKRDIVLGQTRHVIQAKLGVEQAASAFIASGADPDHAVLETVLATSPSAAVRRSAYDLLDQAADTALLEALLRARAVLARALGQPTYAHLALDGRVARSPAVVRDFLLGLARRLAPHAAAELARLGEAVAPADRLFLQARARGPAPALAPYLSLGAALDGVALVLSRVFGLSLSLEPLRPGEATTALYKLEVQRAGAPLGTLYLDLFPRPGKFTGSATFNLQFRHRREPLARTVIVCNLPPTDALAEAPVLLEPGDVSTLFHEFGHALAVLLSDTDFQHNAGTRCPLDFVEVASTLLENFAMHPAVVAEYARHHESREPLPRALLEEYLAQRDAFWALDMELQVFHALSDIELHSVPDGPVNVNEVMARVQHQVCSIAYPRGTVWQAAYNHMVPYGAGYYSYLFSRLFSQAIWAKHFAMNPFNRESGKRLETDLLAFGGWVDPDRVLANLLDYHKGINSFVLDASESLVPTIKS